MLLGHAYICFVADTLGREAAFAAVNDEVEQVRKINQKIDLSNQIWKSFALRSDGSIIELEGAEGKIEIDAEYLGDVGAIIDQYAGAIGSTVSVGVGMELSEANRALAVARIQGGDQTVLWEESMAEVLEQAQEDSEKARIVDDTLAKGDTPAHSISTKDPPVKSQKDHEEGAVTAEVAAGQPEPEMTHAAKDFESQLHDMAQDQDQKDAQNQQQQQGDREKLKAQILQVLDQVKGQAPVLAQIQQVNPQAYQAVMFLVQSVILLGRELMGQEAQQQPMQKEEVWTEESLRKAVLDRDNDPAFQTFHAGNKIVDEGGRPKVLYRGLRTPLGQGKSRFTTESFSDSPDVASIYSATPGDGWNNSPEHKEGANVIPVHVKMTNPLDFTKLGHQIDFNDYLNAMQYGKPNGMTQEEATKVLNYLVNRHHKGMDMSGGSNFKYQVTDDEGAPVQDNTRLFGPLETPLVQFRDDFKSGYGGGTLNVDGYALVDAPRTKEVAQRLGYDGIIHHDIFAGAKYAPTLLNKPTKDVTGVKQQYDELPDAPGEYARPQSVPIHVTYRPFNSAAQVRPLLHDYTKEGQVVKDELPGGKADGMDPDNFDPNELAAGIQHELEHTKDPKVAEEIAMDHLMENPKYYTELEASGVEDMAKMALIWDHAQQGKPSIVWRVQNSVGNGPYTNGRFAIKEAPRKRPAPFAPNGVKPQDFDRDDEKAFGVGEGKYFAFESPEHAKKWFGDYLGLMNKEGHSLMPFRAKKVWRSKSGKQVFFEPHDIDRYGRPLPALDKDELIKDSLPQSHPLPHHHQNLPVGSQVNGKVKVVHADGKQGWKSVRAGQIQGQEGDAPLFGANSHPVSSREPGSK